MLDPGQRRQRGALGQRFDPTIGSGGGATAERGGQAEVRAGLADGFARLFADRGARHVGHRHRAVRGQLDDELAGHAHRRGDAAFEAVVVVQLDPDVVPPGQLPDHEEPHPPGHRDVDLRRPGEPLVDLVDLAGVDAHAAVPDLDDEFLPPVCGADGDLGVRVGEHGGVLQQLGDQVHEVVDHPALDGQVGRVDHGDPRVLLHFGHRRAENLVERHRPHHPAGQVGAAEDQQVLVVPAHARGQVVQLEQAAQLVRVLLVALQPVDQGQLPLHQGLAAARQVDEQVVDVGAQQRLLGGKPQRLLVHRVEGAGHLPDFLVGVHRHRGHRDLGGGARVLVDLVDRVRQALLRDLQGPVAQGAQRAQHRARDVGRDTERHHQQQQQQHRVADQRPRRGIGQGGGIVVEVGQHLVFHRTDQVGALGRLRSPFERVDARRVLAVGRDQRRLLDLLGPVDFGTGDPRGVEGALLGGGGALELRESGLEPRIGGAHRVGLPGEELPTQPGHEQDRALLGELLLGPAECFGGPRGLADLGVDRGGGYRPVDLQQAVEHRVVGDQRLRAGKAGVDRVAQGTQAVESVHRALVGAAYFQGEVRDPRIECPQLLHRRVDPLVLRGVIADPVGTVGVGEHDREVAFALQLVRQARDLLAEFDLLDDAVQPRLGGKSVIDPDPADGQRGQGRHEQDGGHLVPEAPVAQPPLLGPVGSRISGCAGSGSGVVVEHPCFLRCGGHVRHRHG